MSYSSQRTSVLPIQTGLTSNSLPPTLTLPAGSWTRSKLTVVPLIASAVVFGASATATESVNATAAVTVDNIVRFRIFVLGPFGAAAMILPVKLGLVATILLAIGCDKGPVVTIV